MTGILGEGSERGHESSSGGLAGKVSRRSSV